MADMPASFDLTGKVAVVTGAGSGIGRVFSRVFAKAGAAIVVAEREEDRADETVDLVRADGGTAAPVIVDVADPASVEAMAAQVKSQHDRVDILVNNAGIAVPPKRTHELPLDDWRQLIDINLNGVFYVSRAIIPAMLGSGNGSIINISSIAGLVGIYWGFPTMSACYSASKAGVIGLTRQMAVEYATDGIRVNAIAPGWHGGTHLGDRSRATMSNETISRFEDNIIAWTPMERRAVPEELEGLALFLASDASSFMTGQVLTNDGGWTAA